MRRLAPLLVLLAAACEDERCKVDLDCGPLEACVDGACEPLDLGPAREGLCSGDADCSAGERCAAGRCVPDAIEVPCAREGDPACRDATVCTLDPAATCAPPCTAALACRPPAGDAPGLDACDADASCRSGLCLGGVCYRPCASDADCPRRFGCADLGLDDGRTAKGCEGRTAEGTPDPGLAHCWSGALCGEGRRCRFLTDDWADPEEIGLCEPVPEGAVPSFEPCDASTVCEGGMCLYACQTGQARVCGEDRCTGPCDRDEDCPARMTCQAHVDVLGDWLSLCFLPKGGCFDDVDCCPETNETGCLATWDAVGGFCAPRLVQGHLQTLCETPGGLAAPGAPCGSGADCATGVCVEAPAWAASATGRICTSACYPPLDRCPLLLDPASRCEPVTVALEGGEAEVPVCR